jgi:hypothetical protein
MQLPWLLGSEIGIGLLYKSFALLAPVGLVLALWYLHRRSYDLRQFLRRDAIKLVIIAAVALVIFGLWFVFDPDPRSVWNEFVVGENANKFDAHEGGYWATLLWGGSSLWTMLLGYPLNAGLLFFPVLALLLHALRFHHRLTEGEKLLWLCCVVMLVVFCIPSQRSARYLLDAMPAIAVLSALNWRRISRYFYMFTLLAVCILLLLLGSLAMRLQQEVTGFTEYYGVMFWTVVFATTLLALSGILVARFTRPLVNVVVLLGYLVFAMFLRPLDGPLGTFDNYAVTYTQQEDVWVPCNFRAGDEAYRFLLPDAAIHGYPQDQNLTTNELAERYPIFAAIAPVNNAMANCQHCQIIGQRLVIRSRHNEQELQAMLHGAIYEHLFAKEWLIASTRLDSEAVAHRVEEGCR